MMQLSRTAGLAVTVMMAGVILFGLGAPTTAHAQFPGGERDCTECALAEAQAYVSFAACVDRANEGWTVCATQFLCTEVGDPWLPCRLCDGALETALHACSDTLQAELPVVNFCWQTCRWHPDTGGSGEFDDLQQCDDKKDIDAIINGCDD